MRNSKSIFIFVTALLLGLVIVGCGSQSETSTSGEPVTEGEPLGDINYPEREIRVIVPYSPGGSSDLVARKVAQIVNENDLLPKPMVVINLEGGRSLEGLEEVLNADPDGYTLLLHQNNFNVMKALDQLPMSYKDYTMIGQVVESPLVIMGGQKFDTIDEYIEAARQDPGSVTAGVPAIGGFSHFALEYFVNELDDNAIIRSIGFQGGGDALRAQLGGEVDLRPGLSPEAANYAETEELQTLLSLTQEKIPQSPDTPTLRDLGIENEFYMRSGFFAPPGTPREIVDTLADTFRTVTEHQEFIGFFDEQWSTAKFIPADEWDEIFAEDLELYIEIAKGIN